MPKNRTPKTTTPLANTAETNQRKPAEGPNFVWSKRDTALFHVKSLNSKLRKVDELCRRLEIERAPVSPDEYAKKILAARVEAKKAFKEATYIEKAAALKRSFVVVNPLSIYELYSAYMRSGFGYLTPNLPGPRAVTVHRLYPVSCGEVVLNTCLHHDSKYWSSVTYPPRWPDDSMVLYMAELYDDAAWYRKDAPDCVNLGFRLDWVLPVQEKDCVADCYISVRHLVDFENGADDAGAFMSSVGFTEWWDPGQVFQWNDIATTIIPQTDKEKPRKVTAHLSKTFDVPAGITMKVTLCHHFALMAQDGTVDIEARVSTFNEENMAALLTCYISPK